MSDPGSGPPLPPLLPGSNAIGLFQIGISPIGDIPPFNVWSTIIAEYANSFTITSLILSWFYALDVTEDFDNFYDLIWNIATAQGYGLDVWGRIVGVNRVLQVSSGSFLGFEEAGGPGITGWNQGVFYSGEGGTYNVALSDAAFRTLILAKAMANITSGSITAINAILLALFPGQGNAYVAITGLMEITYTFEFTPTPVQVAILEQSNVLPTPAGVTSSFSFP